jgi:hypothetical protein
VDVDDDDEDDEELEHPKGMCMSEGVAWCGDMWYVITKLLTLNPKTATKPNEKAWERRWIV